VVLVPQNLTEIVDIELLYDPAYGAAVPDR
jgi:hypothetical protein